MTKEEFAKTMGIFGTAYNKTFTKEQVSVWFSIFKDIDDVVFKKAIKEVITKNKFMPNIAELKEKCDVEENKQKYEILDFMDSKGYFKKSDYSISEYEKATRWLETGIIPSWFKQDMERYKQMLNQEKLGYTSQKSLSF